MDHDQEILAELVKVNNALAEVMKLIRDLIDSVDNIGGQF
jgi:hypothetical protein